MMKFQVYAGVAALAAGVVFAHPAQAAPRSIEDQQQQILFESMLYDGGTGPSLRDKHPAAAGAASSPRQTLLPAVVFEDNGQQASAPVDKVAVRLMPPPAQPRQLASQPVQQTHYKVTPMAAAYSTPAIVPQPAQYSAPPQQRVAAVPPTAAVSPAPPASNDLYHRARAGDPDAEYQMGMMFAQDRTTNGTQGADQSFHWFTQAASKGHKRAQYNLGVMNAQGEGTVQNLIEAYIWFNLSAAQHMEGATEARDMVAASLTPDALMKAQERSTFYQQKISQNLAQMEKSGPGAVVPIR